MFWSDLGPEISYVSPSLLARFRYRSVSTVLTYFGIPFIQEAVGNIDATSPTVGVWAKGSDNVKVSADAPPASQKDGKLDEQYGKGVVFYMDRKKKIGEFFCVKGYEIVR